jgi:hypothetical protein
MTEDTLDAILLMLVLNDLLSPIAPLQLVQSIAATHPGSVARRRVS